MKTDLNQEKMAVVFPGQGSQCFGLGRTLIDAFPEARKLLDRFSEITDTDLYHLHTCQEIGVEEDTVDTVNVHLSMVSYGLLSWELLTRVHRFKPSVVAGHSLGEITALACSGVIQPEDALRLAKIRGRLIADAVKEIKGGMKALGGRPLEEIRSQVVSWKKMVNETSSGAKPVFEANINSPRQLVVSGQLTDLNEFEKKLEEKGIGAITLPVSGAFHSPYMNQAAARFYKEIKKIKFYPAKLPVLSAMDGRIITAVNGIPERLALHMVKPVNWLHVMSVLRQAGIRLMIEAGPGKPVLCQLAGSDTSWDLNTRSVSALIEDYQDSCANKIKGNVP